LHGQSPFENRIYVKPKVTRAFFRLKAGHGGKPWNERNGLVSAMALAKHPFAQRK
jgi:hypothetical protein